MRSGLARAFLASAAAAWCAAAAFGAEAHGGEQVSIFAGNLGNAFWTLLIFLLVLAVLRKFAWGPILSGLQKRERYICDTLESARRDREAAEARLREYEQRLAGAQAEALEVVEEARRDAEAVRKRIEEETRQSANAMVERARREIQVAADTVLRELYDRSADLAASMAGSILKRQLAPEDHQRLVQEALAELQERRDALN